jgi:hypothetical protein
MTGGKLAWKRWSGRAQASATLAAAGGYCPYSLAIRQGLSENPPP